MRTYLILALVLGIPALGAEALLIAGRIKKTKSISKRSFIKKIFLLGILASGPVIAVEYLLNPKSLYLISMVFLTTITTGSVFSLLNWGEEKAKAVKNKEKQEEEKIKSFLKKRGLEGLAKDKEKDKDCP
ncbi:MAG: hypothetical protein ACOCTL_03180 [Candidatus Hadarchaeota archaeon]